MTIFSSFRKAVEEALPAYCEKYDFDNRQDALESFLYDFVYSGEDDLFDTTELRDQLVAVSFPEVDWKNTNLPEPIKTPEMKEMDEAVNDFTAIMDGFMNPLKELCHE